jgi:DNA-binding winged helix-turn-helix (wHTH) protein/TolB-like protein
MEAPSAGSDWQFEGFRLDRSGGVLSRSGNGHLVPLGSRALRILQLLVEQNGELVTKQQIFDAVWPGLAVEEANLTVQISAVRKVLDAGRTGASCIRTVPGRGYQFAWTVTRATDIDNAGQPGVAWRRRSMVLVVSPLLVVLAAAALVVGGVGWVAPGRQNAPLAYSPQDRRQSIIVLSFENRSTSPVQDDVAASVTREVTDIFALDKSVPSIPAAVAAEYNGKGIDLRRIGREHDVHFALLGNSRQQDGRLIVSATLYETDHGNQIWGQRFERTDGLEAGAWMIASLIHQNVDQATTDEEVRSALRDHPGQLDKRDLMLAAYASDKLQNSKPGIQAQIALIDRALALDPNYLWALRAKGRRHADLVILGFSDDPARDVVIAAEAVDRALQLAPNDYSALKEKTYVLRAQGNWAEAEALTRRLLELRPRVSARHSNLGSILMAQGRNIEALDYLLAARRLQIATDDISVVDANIAAALLAGGRAREAIDQARLAIPEFTSANGRVAELPWLVLIAAETTSGRTAEARADLNRFLAVRRTWNTIAAVEAVPFIAHNPPLLDGLREAGMPLR